MTSAISIKNLNKTYKNGFVALKDVNLEIKEGDFFALLGPNGAGKSTTIGILSSLVNKSSGEVKIAGVDIDENFAKAKSYLGVVPQEFNLSIFETVESIILNQAGYYGISKQEAEKRLQLLLNPLGLEDKRDNKIIQLSGGMKRRVMIARALIHNPKILILDEPTAGVDVELRHSMWEFINQLHKEGLTIILTTHYLEEAEELSKNVAIINNGEIIEHTSTKQLLNQSVEEIYVLELKGNIKHTSKSKKFEYKIRDETSVEVTLQKDQSVNEIIKDLDKLDLEVLNLRTKQNRLEALFVQKTKKKEEA